MLFALPAWISCQLISLFACGMVDTTRLPASHGSPCYQLTYVPFETERDPGLFKDAYQEANGYLWLTSTAGLNVFDGRYLSCYANGYTKGPLSADPFPVNLGTISGHPQDPLIVQDATSAQVLRFDPQRRVLLPPLPAGVPAGWRLMAFAQATGDTGLALLVNVEQSNCQLLTLPGNRVVYQGPFHGEVDHYLRFDLGQYWFFNGRTVLRIEPGRYQVHRYTLPPASKGFDDFSIDGGQLYLLDTWGRDIYTWQPQADSLVFFHRLPWRAHRMAVDRGLVFAGGSNYCWIIDPQTGQLTDHTETFRQLIGENETNAQGYDLSRIIVARDHSILLIRQRAIYRFKPCLPPTASFVQTLQDDPLQSAPPYRALAEDTAGNLYASYYLGLAIKKGGQGQVFRSIWHHQPLDTTVKTAYHLNWWKGQMLWNNALVTPSNRGYTLLTPPTLGHTTQLLWRDTLWLYNWRTDQLYAYDLQRRIRTAVTLDKTIGRADGIIEEMNALIPDASGQGFWTAMKWEGIALIDRQGHLLKKYGREQLRLQGTLGATVNALALYRDSLWFGCSEGLGVLDPASGQVTLYRDPFLAANSYLQNRVVFSFIEDPAQNLYVGTDHGIVYFNRQERQFYHLPDGHPLSAIECNRASVYRARDGRYYFGTTNGLYAFESSMLSFTPVSLPMAPPLIERAAIFNSLTGQERYLGAAALHNSTIELGPFENNLEFRLSAPAFDHPVFYWYELTGPVRRSGDYTNSNALALHQLEPGSYTLLIKAASTVSDRGAGTTRLRIFIPTVWYKRTWVIIAAALLVLAVAFGLAWYRFGQRLKRAQALALLRTQISQDLHDDVGSILTSISLQSQFMVMAPRPHDPQSLQEMSLMSNEAMEKMRDIVWSIDSRKDRYEDLIDRMRSFAEQVLESKGITCRFILDQIDGGRFIDPVTRKNIYLIFKEAITNIVKHSDASIVVVRFRQDKTYTELCIHDNGLVQPTPGKGGLGMDNMHSRAKAMQASLRTGYEKGFFVELTMPAGK